MRSKLFFILCSILIIQYTNAQNFWELTSGATGKIVQCMKIKTTGDIFAGTNDAGIYRSTDNGTTWVQTNIGLLALKVSDIAFHPDGYIYIGIDGGGNGSSDWGVYRSIDNGNNWTQTNNGLYLNTVRSLAINQNRDLFAGVGFKIYKSTNYGDNWTEVLSLNNSTTEMVINSQGHIFASVYGRGVYRSIDDGNNWSYIGLDMTVTAMAINSRDELYAAKADNRVWRLLSDGNWVYAGLLLTPYSLAVNSLDHVYAGCLYDGIMMTTDNGSSWSFVNEGLTNDSVYSLAISPNGYIFAGTLKGIYRGMHSTTSINEEDFNVSSYSLSQNYPNPFNPATTIKFSIPHEGFVTLKIYDVLGMEIKTVVSDVKETGIYEVKFDASSLSGGIYIYSLHAQGISLSKKMIVLK